MWLGLKYSYFKLKHAVRYRSQRSVETTGVHHVALVLRDTYQHTFNSYNSNNSDIINIKNGKKNIS